jgi:glutamyl-tRNA synthetase
MRVEDLDPPRVVPGAEERILEDLRWLGLDWDEGPDVGGQHAPYRQSERYPAYREALERLRAEGRLYACECSRAQLRGLLSAPHGPQGEGPAYPGTCRAKRLPLDLGDDLGDATAPGCRRTAVRLSVPGGEICFDDLVSGRFCQDVAREVGDFALRRADGLFTYQLAVVVDDAAMGVTQVVRGEDLLHSTPRQILLQEALRLPRPEYAHVPLVLGPGGERLAKRDRGAAIGHLRRAGARPEQVVGDMAYSLGLLAAPEPARPADLAAEFAWRRLSREPWRLGAAET